MKPKRGLRPPEPLILPGFLPPPLVLEPQRLAVTPGEFPPGVASRPDTVVDTGFSGVVRVAASSTRGFAHRFYGQARQDDYSYGIDAHRRYLIVAVADGVGSTTRGDLAAVTATRYAVTAVAAGLATDSPSDLDWNDVFVGAAWKVVDIGRRVLNAPQADERAAASVAATTLAVAVVPTDGRGPSVFATVGDTGAWFVGHERLVPLAGLTAVISEASNYTRALPLITDGDVAVVSRSTCQGDRFLVCTDGIAKPLGDGRGRLGLELARRWRSPCDGLDVAADLRFQRPGFDDDRTAVIMWVGDS